MQAFILAAILAAADPGAGAAAETARPAELRDWLANPSGDQASRYYPDAAQRMEINGVVQLDCRVTRSKTLEDCRVVSETPAGYRFGEQAIKLTQFMRMKAPSRKEARAGLVRRGLTINFQVPN